jgi:hypothetical protein
MEAVYRWADIAAAVGGITRIAGESPRSLVVG